MARPKKQETPQVEYAQSELDQMVFNSMGEFKTNLVKSKLKDNDLKKLIQRLLIEWAQGRVNL